MYRERDRDSNRHQLGGAVAVGLLQRHAAPIDFLLRLLGTSLIRNCNLLGPYSRTVPRALWWP